MFGGIVPKVTTLLLISNHFWACYIYMFLCIVLFHCITPVNIMTDFALQQSIATWISLISLISSGNVGRSPKFKGKNLHFRKKFGGSCKYFGKFGSFSEKICGWVPNNAQNKFSAYVP